MSESAVTVKKYTEDNYNKLNFESIERKIHKNE